MIVSVHADGKSGKCQCERIVLTVRDGSLSMSNRGSSLLFMKSPAQEQAMMAHRGKSVRQRISGVESECALQKYQRFCHLSWHPGIDVGLSLQDKVIGIEAIRPLALDALNFGSTQARLDGANDVQSDLVLKRKNVIERTIEALGPQMASTSRLDHLGCDAYTIAVFTQASLEQ